MVETVLRPMEAWGAVMEPYDITRRGRWLLLRRVSSRGRS